MPVLTPKELQIMRGKIIGTDSETQAALDKLDQFQATKTSIEHIQAINYFIPKAEKEVLPGMNVALAQHVFSSAMNRLTRAAGLRC